MAKKKDGRAKRPAAAAEDLSTRLLLQSTALASAGNGVMITDQSGAILWVNPAFTTITGYTPEEVKGANPRLLKSGHQDGVFYGDFWKTILSGRTWRGEFINRRKDGSIYINEETITPVRLNGGEITHFVGIMQDVTDRREAEAQVRELTDQLEDRVRQRTAELERANRELEAFAYSVSHDLRAPLRHIKGFLDLLGEGAREKLSQEERHYLAQIAGSARHMDRLIDDLLLFSRMGQAAMNPEGIQLNQVLQEALAELEPELQGRTIRWVKGDLPRVNADGPMLRQVLINLLSNAIKFTVSRSAAEIEIGAKQSDDEVVVSVRDNGVGFDMRFANKLFGLFQRLHSAAEFPGTGVGLANVRRIIARHGGRTWGEGKPGDGATFYFSLPTL